MGNELAMPICKRGEIVYQRDILIVTEVREEQ
jgi:hypothetical protein